MFKILKKNQLILILTIILSFTIVGISIGFYISETRNGNRSNCDGSICVYFSVNSCDIDAPLDTKINIINRTVFFHQNLSSYCLPHLDSNHFRMELLLIQNTITIKEIFKAGSDPVTMCVRPHGINGTIIGLDPGYNNLTFLFDNRYGESVYVLKTFNLVIL
ncbi:MAG: hypothetical protein ACFFA3_00130 [Promethearchaeota archaeon]